MEKRKKTLLILGLCIFTLALVGLSYAFWQITLKQSDENLVFSDCLKLEFTEEHSIQLQNAYPMTFDELEDFFAKETPYHFTIKNECNSKANLSINLETLPIEAEQTKLDDEWVDVILYEGKENYTMYETTVLNNYEFDEEYNEHYKLTTNPKNENKLIEDSLDAYNLYNFTIDKGATKDFSMYLYLDEDTPYQTEDGRKTTNTQWKGKVTINAAYRLPIKGMLRKINSSYDEDPIYDNEGMWQYHDQITQIVFEDQLQPHEGTELVFDESIDQDGSVMSYLVPTGDQVEVWDLETADSEMKEAYTAYIQGNGKVIANPDSSYLFFGFGNVESMELQNLDTSQVTNMSNMFRATSYMDVYYGALGEKSYLKSLDLTGFDTSNVTDMGYMFYYLSYLNELNLGESFDTSRVTNMTHMFSMFEPVRFGTSLVTLNLGEHFNTSNVTDMSYMFYHLTNLTELNLGKQFDTSNVKNMNDMFGDLSSLQTLDLGSKFDTSKVTDMSAMFYQMNSLTTLDLSQSYFDTSQVKNMSFMFSGMESLTELNLGEHFNTNQVTNMEAMFSGALTELNLGALFDTSNVTSMNSMFSGLNLLTTLDLSQSHFDTSKVENMRYMFSGMENLNELNLGNLFDTSQVTNMERMFFNMTSLTTLDLSQGNFDTSQVTDMSWMFKGDSVLSQINYGNHFVHKPDADVSQMFEECLESLNKPTDESWTDVNWT